MDDHKGPWVVIDTWREAEPVRCWTEAAARQLPSSISPPGQVGRWKAMPLLAAHEFEVPLGNGVVQNLRGHPRYCPNDDPHESHTHHYVYLDRSGEIWTGRYLCDGISIWGEVQTVLNHFGMEGAHGE